MTDEALMARFKRDLDEQAFRILAERYFDRAVTVAGRVLGGLADPEDAVQEAFIRVVRYRGRFKTTRAFRPWFYAILRNVCIDMQRKALREAERDRAYAGQPQTAGPAPSALQRVRALMERLTTEDASLLRLRYVDGLSFAEIAAALGCSLAAAKKRHQRVLSRLR
jgi:RNA polymerase sigma-70 factor (ECF subfamily)